MISKLELADFPISKEQTIEALQLVAKELHARYRSQFTMVVMLPQSLLLGKYLEEQLMKERARPLTMGIGVVGRKNENGDVQLMIVAPPSEHAIRNKRIVVFDATGNWESMRYVCNFLNQFSPSSIEVSSFLTRGAPPAWVNKDYVAFEIDKDVVVTGLGIGYNQGEASGGALVATTLESEAPPSDEERT